MGIRKISGILANTTELKKLILEHPGYPIAVLCSENANCGDYVWMYASDIRFGVGTLLDCVQPVDDCCVFNDKDFFYEKLKEWLFEHMCYELNRDIMHSDDKKPTEEEFKKRFEEEKAKYEQYWKDCIFIYADN